MSIYQSKYDNSKVALLKQLLLNKEKSGQPMEYEIKAGELKVVPRTADTSFFDLYEDYITGDTETITITLYEGHGSRSDKHIFSLKDRQAQPAASLAGVDIDKKVEEKVDAIKKQMEYDKVVEENKELKEQIKEAEEFIDKLENALKREKGERLKIKGVHLGEIASVAAESLIRRNPRWLSGIPGGVELAGLITEENANKENYHAPEPQGETTFSPQEETEELSEADKERLGVLRELQESFDENEQEQFFALTRLLMAEKRLIMPTLTYAARLKEKQTQSAKNSADDKSSHAEKTQTPRTDADKQDVKEKGEEDDNRELPHAA